SEDLRGGQGGAGARRRDGGRYGPRRSRRWRRCNAEVGVPRHRSRSAQGRRQGQGRRRLVDQVKLSEVSIQRPVLATVMSLAILLFGVLSFTFLPVREYPDIESPVVSVTTFYRGANPQVVETEITDVLEEQLSTIEGVKVMTSSSQEQVSSITIEFQLRRDVDKAANDVRDRVSRVRGDLPSTADEPIVAKQDVNAQPIIWLALFGKNFSTLELSDIAYNVFSEQLH